MSVLLRWRGLEREPQTTASVFMVRPARFAANAETAGTNAFQSAAPGASSPALLGAARREFDGLVAALRAEGVEVLVVEDEPEPPRPDAVFPNNWISLHGDGTAVLYPLLAESRRLEVRLDVLERLEERGLFARRRLVDLRPRAAALGFLEGTGSLVLDRVARRAYACLSPRTARPALEAFCAELDYRPVAFHAADARGVAVYHTNVMLALGRALAVVCLEAIDDARERAAVEHSLVETGHELVSITRAQMGEFAGNVLELRGAGERALWAMSSRARRAFTPGQLQALARHGTVVDSALDTIESHGGGSARCMIAEVFSPRGTPTEG